MVTQEAPELPPFHSHIKCRAPHKVITSERKPENNCVTPRHWTIPIFKAETQSCHTPYPQLTVTQLRGNFQLPASSWGGVGWDFTFSAQTFKTLTPGQNPQNILLWKLLRIASQRPTRLTTNKIEKLRDVQDLCVSTEGAGKIVHLPVFLLKVCNYILWNLLPKHQHACI